MKPWAAAGLACSVAAGVLAWAAGGMSSATATAPAGAVAGSTWRAPSLMAAGGDAATGDGGAAVAVLTAEDDAERTARVLFTDGSLQGTTLPPWGVARDAPLLPQRALRDRFDHYLLGLGEVPLARLRALVQRDARRDLGERTAAAVMDLWDRYLRLQQHPFQHVARPGDLGSITVALQERVQVRQSVLGQHWARAFYADDEQALVADVARAAAGQSGPRDDMAALLNPPPGTDPAVLKRERIAQFGAERAARLQAIDDEQVVWDARVADARAAGRSLQADASLSAVQRAEALDGLMSRQFPQAEDRLRAGALLGW